jgi:transposase
MATRRLPMNRTREILRLRWSVGESVRRTARAMGVSHGVVSKATGRAERAGLDWAAVEQLDDAELEERLYGLRQEAIEQRPEPDLCWVHQEYKRVGVTLELLHLEYLQQHPDGYSYTTFCDRYRSWLKRRGLSMRQHHHAGEKAFLDYSGKKPHYIDRETGECVEVELFVAVLGASNYTFADVTPTQQLEHWVGSNVRALGYFGGCPRALVPDQLKSAVTEADVFDPGIQRTYEELSRHYGTVIFPARPGKARDKAKVEVGVQIAQRWILARLRNETFFSLAELRQRVAELLEELNSRPMKKLGGVSRRELFERYERDALLPLPAQPFEPAVWVKVKANVDYHVEFAKHWYSVPYWLRHEEIWLRVAEKTVEGFHCGKRVAAHARSHEPYRHTTDPAHRSPNHRAWAEADHGALQEWANMVGPATALLMQRILSRSPFAEQAWRSGRGLKRMGEKYDNRRIEVAAERALRFGARSYKPVARMLKLGLDLQPLAGDEQPGDSEVVEHENVRGPGYYLN